MSTHKVMFPTMVPYSPTIPVPTVPGEFRQGTQFILSTGTVSGIWTFYTSAFPDQLAMQTCDPIFQKGTVFRVGLPPLADQFRHLILPTRPRGSTTAGVTSSTDAIATRPLHEAGSHPPKSHTINHVPSKTLADNTRVAFSIRIPSARDIGSRPPESAGTAGLASSLLAAKHFAMPFSTAVASTATEKSVSGYVVDSRTLLQNGLIITSPGSTYSAEASGFNGDITPATTQVLGTPLAITMEGSTVTGDRRSEYKVGSDTLLVNGPAITLSGSVYSLATSDTALVEDGKTTTLAAQPSRAPTITQGLPDVSVTGGRVLVDGQTLLIGSTITLGSGTVATRVFLKTNSAGQTELVGYSLPAARATDTLGAHAMVGLQNHSSARNSNSTIPTPAGPVLSSSPPRLANGVAQPARPCSVLNWMVLSSLTLYVAFGSE